MFTFSVTSQKHFENPCKTNPTNKHKKSSKQIRKIFISNGKTLLSQSSKEKT